MSGRPLTGFLCPWCSDATDHAGVAGAIGMAAVQRSLRDHLAATGNDDTVKSLTRIELPPPSPGPRTSCEHAAQDDRYPARTPPDGGTSPSREHSKRARKAAAATATPARETGT